MAKLQTLDEWAATIFQSPPCAVTLRRWARGGNIYPPPEKHGKTYYVQPTARYVSGKAPRLRDRIRRVA